MVVSFDGNIYCGKTTTIAKLKEVLSNCEVVEEYYPANSGNYWRNQVHYISQEIQRSNKTKQLGESTTVLVDRSVLSVLAYNWSAFRLGLADVRYQCYELLDKLIQNKSVVIPQFFVLLENDYHSMKKRYIMGECFGIPRNCEKVLASKEFYYCYNDFIEGFFLTLPSNAFLIADPFMESEKIVAYIKTINDDVNKIDYSDLILSYLFDNIK